MGAGRGRLTDGHPQSGGMGGMDKVEEVYERVWGGGGAERGKFARVYEYSTWIGLALAGVIGRGFVEKAEHV